MNFRKILASLLSLYALSLLACSGSNKNQPSPGGGGTATLALTFRATPLSPPPNTNLLSFFVDINTITLTPTTGKAINIPLNATSFGVDLTKVQSDSVFLGASATIPAGSYSSIAVSITNPALTFCTQTLGNIGCASGSVATISGAAAAPQITSAPFPLTLTVNEKTGLAINLNLGNALTVSTTQPQVVTAVNLAAANVLSASTLPPTVSSLATGQLDFIEDVTGAVTAVNTTTQSVTVHTATRGSLTALADTSTVFSPNCTAFNLSLSFSSCVVQGHIASLDMILNSDGTFKLLEYDPLDITTKDWVEGIITFTPSSTTQFQLVANDLVVSTSNSLLGNSLPLASPINISLVTSPQPFVVDTKGLIAPTNAFSGRTDTSALAPGQTVAARLTAFTAASGSTLATASTDFLYLRFTRVTGTVATVAPPNTFTMQSFPPFFALTTPITVQLSTGSPSTNFDGVSSSSNLTVGQTVSINALYFGPPVGLTSTLTPFSAAKLRVP
jgi:Domain of unknown function (DUF4382)